MFRRYWLLLTSALAIMALPGLAFAIPLGNARLISVTPVDGGCVSGPTGPAVQSWDTQPGKTYTLTINNVTECANGGTDATLDVRVNSSGSGNTDVVATLVAPGTYQFSYTLPADATCTIVIFYCTTPGNASTGFFVRRNDGGAFESHLRAATFGAGCTNPQQILGPFCTPTPTHPLSWARLKTIYR